MVFTGGVSAVECVPYDLVDAGDHTVAIARVVGILVDLVGGQQPWSTSTGGTTRQVGPSPDG